jgi:LmbE family N-acetylglucosaminyl deacetylase
MNKTFTVILLNELDIAGNILQGNYRTFLAFHVQTLSAASIYYNIPFGRAIKIRKMETTMQTSFLLLEPEGWDKPQTILLVLAHPDDPEFFLGATIARWTQAGHTVHYCLLTRGDKGVRDQSADPLELARTREHEQRAAADILGVSKIYFLDYEDGYLVPDIEARRAVTRVIRLFRPDILVSSDPTQLFGDNNINHPDHRAAGQIVVDAVFPAAGNPLFFPELLEQEGLAPHSVNEVWLAVTGQPNTVINVTAFWEKKIEALHHHATQISDMNVLDERMRSRRTADSSPEAPRFEEKFRRIKYR